MRLKVWPAHAALEGHCRPPGDKSISHRLAILGGLAKGTTRITGYLDSADTLATLAAMSELGAHVERGEHELVISGRALRAPAGALDLGNSGTGMRLLAGALAGHPDLHGSEISLVGDASLSSRPMGRIIEPLKAMGADIRGTDGHAPLILRPRPLEGLEYRSPVASAQVKSAVALAGLHASGRTAISEPAPTRDHTERLLPMFGARIESRPGWLALEGGQLLHGCRARVPADLSAAAFLLAAACLVEGSEVTVEEVGLNPTRDGFLRILDAMGGRLDLQPDQSGQGEPAGRVVARHSVLRGMHIAEELVPLAIDEFPVIMAMAAVANGETVISGAGELRVKESDRLAAMCANLGSLGVSVTETADGAIVRGGSVRGGEVDACHDHRIAMSLAVLALVAEQPVIIHGAEWMETSYPGFVDDLRGLGARLEWMDA